MLLIGAFGALFLGIYLRRRLSATRETATAIMAGDMSQRIRIGPAGDEFDQLAMMVNVMLDRIAMLVANVRQVSADIAHDLHTPLARLRNELRRASAAGDPTERKAMIESAISQSDDVLALFAAILRISEIEEGGLRSAFTPLSLSEIAVDVCESYAPIVEDGGRMLEWSVAPEVSVFGDAELLAQAMVNLIDNGQKHTPSGTRVSLRLAMTGDRVVLTVADNGPGVAVADRARILQRFTRLEASRTRPGHGLGLNLVAAIANAHSAELEIGEAAPGLQVVLRFPPVVAR
ncbi:sensor histidine kinase [Sphingomonas nostoxanthinifaciens]|uniref:sensor histidine kinase n=1 Tax=Sphingomonas nostoxanthinifaciens TaxID=2872652 RepID=UPI001CC20C70|nr:HAMP domain-containing sensor histidine kinase [Sphingomonas nostoxanthinifaciens]